MKLRLTGHLRRRMAQRGIADWQVRATIGDPLSVTPTPESSLRYLKAFDMGRVLKVWVVDPPEADGELVVKSAAWKGESDDDDE